MRLAVIALIFAEMLSAGPNVAGKLAPLKPGRRVDVVLDSGDHVVGKLGTVSADSFALEPDQRSGQRRDLRFSEVRSVSPKMTRGTKWAIAGGVYAGLVAIGLVLGK